MIVTRETIEERRPTQVVIRLSDAEAEVLGRYFAICNLSPTTLTYGTEDEKRGYEIFRKLAFRVIEV